MTGSQKGKPAKRISATRGVGNQEMDRRIKALVAKEREREGNVNRQVQPQPPLRRHPQGKRGNR